MVKHNPFMERERKKKTPRFFFFQIFYIKHVFLLSLRKNAKIGDLSLKVPCVKKEHSLYKMVFVYY